MNKIQKFTLTLSIALAAALTFSCSSDSSDDDEGGILIITDFPSKYNGKYASFEYNGNDTEGYDIWGAKIINNFANGDDDIRFVKIENGKVSLPLWKFEYSTESLSRYSGNDTFTDAWIMYSFTETFDDHGSRFTIPSITFSNGNATISFHDFAY